MDTNERIPYRGKIRPGTVVHTQKVDIADDNLVCFICGCPLGKADWTIVSSPEHKGIVIFSCQQDIPKALNKLGAFLGLAEVPVFKLKLPDRNEN
jgi:hypothetical protein